MRKPSTPRSSQNRRVSSIASTTSGLRQLRSGCSLRKLWRYHCWRVSSHVHAGPPVKAATQLFGGFVGSSGSGSLHQYQSAFGLSRDERDSTNQGCWSLVWLGTQSIITLRSRSWASASIRSKSARSPKSGSTSQ